MMMTMMMVNLMQQGHEADNSFPTIAEVKNTSIYVYSRLHLLGVVLN
jgi:hypothetical protein